MSDGEDYGFEYSDDDQEEEDVNIENQYYNSKGLLADSDLQGALDGFKEVVTMEDEKGEWGFKAHKQMVRAVHPPRTLPRAAPPGPLRACTARTGPAASPQRARSKPPAAPRQVKLQFKQKNYKEMMVTYKVMLTYIKCAHAHRSALALSPAHCTPRGSTARPAPEDMTRNKHARSWGSP